MDFPRFCRHLQVVVRGAFKRLGTYTSDVAVPGVGRTPFKKGVKRMADHEVVVFSQPG